MSLSPSAFHQPSITRYDTNDVTNRSGQSWSFSPLLCYAARHPLLERRVLNGLNNFYQCGSCSLGEYDLNGKRPFELSSHGLPSYLTTRPLAICQRSSCPQIVTLRLQSVTIRKCKAHWHLHPHRLHLQIHLSSHSCRHRSSTSTKYPLI